MTRCIITRSGRRVERLNRLPSSPRIQCRGTGHLPSDRYGVRWRALPVEGSKAWQRNQGGIIARIFSR